MLEPLKIATSHEDLFLERYERLLVWALQVSGQDRSTARDLVHDAFIQFTFTRPDLHRIDNLDAYLYGMLRHLYLSSLRRATRHALQPLSIIEYDSAAAGLRAFDAATQAQIHDALRKVCAYACARKQSSKAGAILILRFFHGYYPSEIAQIIRASRQVVDERLRVARAEAKLYLENPNRLAFMKESDPIINNPRASEMMTGDLLHELRQTIFQARTGDCSTPERLREQYGANKPSLTCDQLAHLVSCPVCLDEVNHLLGLPPLSDRYPTDMIGPNAPGAGSSEGVPPSLGAPPDEVSAMRRRAREVFEHQPRQIAISVNGRLSATQKLGAEINEQTLRLNVNEPIGFIELFSEQQVRLLLLNVTPPPQGGPQQEARVELSDGRTLEASLSFNSLWPALRVVYTSPMPQGAEAGTADCGLRIADCGLDKEELGVGEAETKRTFSNRIRSLFSAIRDPRSAIRSPHSPLSIWGAVTAIIAVALIVTFALLRTPTPPVSAAELLRRSAAAEAATASRPEVVIHRRLTLEERRSPGGELLHRRRIEVWQSAERKIKARRLYDERDQLIAGEWTRADGSRAVYHRGARPQDPTPAALGLTPAQSLLEVDEVWRLELAAQDFSNLIGAAATATVEEGGEFYRISYTNQPPNGSALTEATITLAKPDLRAISQTLLVSRGAEVRQYLFSEDSFTQLQTQTAPPSVFEPDPALLGVVEKRREGDDAAKAQATAQTAAVASAELEVEVTYLLNRIKANLGEQVTLARTAAGALRVEALVETEERKQEILRVLAPALNHPAVKVEVSTVAEALQRRKPSVEVGGANAVREVEIASGTIPADADLRRYFSSRLTDRERIDEEINRFARRMMSRSRQALLHASALKGLVERFSPEALRALDPAAQAKWRAMIAEHAQACQREINALNQELQPIFFPAAPTAATDVAKTADDLNPAEAARRLLKLSYANDEMMRAAFAISNEIRTSDSLKAPHARHSLLVAERLANAIERMYQQ